MLLITFVKVKGKFYENPLPHVCAGPTLGQRVRAFCFYITTYIVAVPLFFIMLFVQPFVLMFDKHKRKAQHFINKIWANLTILLFYKAEIEGLENLPGPDDAAVYVSNHQSFLDIYTLFLLGRPFKFISKTSNFLIPIIGWSMYLTGHVPLRRMDTKSQMVSLLILGVLSLGQGLLEYYSLLPSLLFGTQECLRHCQKLIKQGVPVFFFPEGTRSRDGKMAKFKVLFLSLYYLEDPFTVACLFLSFYSLRLMMQFGVMMEQRGAFTIAAKAQVPVVPISLIGTGKLMPNGLEGTLRPGTVKVIIHPPLHGNNPDELSERSRDVISKSLLQHGLEVH